ncbi:hypothetical protein L6164_009560 [Bauhinia variegata]|uniref:Uncharacterized protein n=1 Tax=Bauhinia variegata TaxID=167791 RepID=A0ACB9PLR6_BAUVA|nr:hypothetical protein L6164_009560 [Bauhinia variegata]
MSEKDSQRHRQRRRRIIAFLLLFLFIILLVILIIFLALRPSKPAFVLQDVTVYAFNATVPNFLTSSLLVTICSRNPNDNIGVYYNRLEVYATHHSQQITHRTSLPPSYQGHNEVIIWSPLVYGTDVPVAPFIFSGLVQDQYRGNIFVTIKIDGRVRWKVGPFVSSRYHLYVRCRAFINVGTQRTGITVGDNAVKYQLDQRCDVSV